MCQCPQTIGQPSLALELCTHGIAAIDSSGLVASEADVWTGSGGFIHQTERQRAKPWFNFLFIMAQDRTLGNTTENVTADMKTKSSMFHKKFFFYKTHSLTKWKKKNLIKYWSESPPAGQKWFCGWNTWNYWSTVGVFTIHTKLPKKTCPQPLARCNYKAEDFVQTRLTLQSFGYNWVNTD